MKLLRIIRSLNPLVGGPAEGIRQITPHLIELGVSTTVASLDPPDAPWLSNQSFQAIGLGPVASNYGFRRDLVACIRSLANEHDVVIIQGIWQYHSYATWLALRGSRIPYFVYPHGMLDPWFKHKYPFKHLKKWLYWPWADYRVLRDASGVLFTTNQERLLARQSFWLYQANEVVVGYGTSAPPPDAGRQRDAFLKHFPNLRGQRFLLFLSRIHPKKGVDLLVEAFAEVSARDPALQLLIAGPDQVGLQAGLQQRAASLGIAHRITWSGMLSGEVKWGAFRCAELFCLPSHQENFGIVVAEALACGLPVAIAKPVNIACDVATAGAGIVHPDTELGTISALRQWLELPLSVRAEMGESGLKLFNERFNFSSVSSNIIPVMEDALRLLTIP